MRFDSFEAYAFIFFPFNVMRREALVINRELRYCNCTTDVVRYVSPCVDDGAIVVALWKNILSFQLSSYSSESFEAMHRLL